MAKAKWSARDNSRACRKQGWAVFNGDEIQRDDECGAFKSDNAAFRFIANTALTGNKLAAKVLRFLDRVNPKQAKTIRSFEEGA